MSNRKSDRIDGLMGDLADVVGASHVTADRAAMERLGFLPEMHPEVLVFPGDAGEVQEIVSLAGAGRIPLIPVGGGTRIGQVLSPFTRGIGISLTRMDRILELEPDNLSVVVEAGVPNHVLQPALHEKHIFLPVPPEFPRSTIGGEVAGNYSSWKRYRYGNIRDYVLGLTFVSPEGRIVKTGGKTVKNASGYDFTKLLSGSWGTLGILVSVTLKLKPLPEKEVILRAAYPSVKEAVAAGSRIMATRTSLSSFNVYRQIPNDPGQSACFGVVCLEGSREAVDSHFQTVRSLMGGSPDIFDDPDRLASFRKDYLKTRHDLQQAGGHMMVFDKRVTDKMVPVLEHLENQAAVYDFDPAAGVLEFSIPAAGRRLPDHFKDTWTKVVKDLDGRLWSLFDGQKPRPLLDKLYSRLDPSGLMFPDNILVRDIKRGQ